MLARDIFKELIEINTTFRFGITKALYTYQLHPFDGITFNFDYATRGVGCTALSVFTAYQVFP